MLCPICRVLMSDILIHLKGCAKTVPLHTTLPANPRYWLGADSKATPVGLCTTQSQVIDRKSNEKKLTTSHKCHSFPFIHAHGVVIYFLFSITVAQFCFFWWTTTLSLVYSSGHSPSVFLFHMDTRVGEGGGWMNGAACCHIIHVRFLKGPFLKEASGLVRSPPTILEPLSAAVMHPLLMVQTNCMTVESSSQGGEWASLLHSHTRQVTHVITRSKLLHFASLSPGKTFILCFFFFIQNLSLEHAATVFCLTCNLMLCLIIWSRLCTIPRMSEC